MTTMDLDEILTEYEALWRQAALDGRGQYIGEVCGGSQDAPQVSGPDPTCAMVLASVVGRDDLRQGAMVPSGWTCDCGWRGGWITSVMMHLNNAHHWTWDMFANKFRDALAQGRACG